MGKQWLWAPTLLVTLLSGCGTGLRPTSTTVTNPGGGGAAFISGVVHGGQNPVSGSTVQLWQVGTTGYGQGATTLGNSVQTQADGSFVLTGAYSCANGESGDKTLVYLTASGGNPGLGNTNSAIVLMAAIGYCGSLTPNTFIEINEVTTVAAAYALNQFMDPTGDIGSYGGSSQGLANAFATVNNLVNTSQGTARAVTPAGNGIVPQAEINTLANILSTCVNSSGPSSAACTALFDDARPNIFYLSNTFSAALTIAQNPGSHVHDLFTIPTPDAPFQPALTTTQQPNDWTIAISYATGGNNPAALAIDGLGDVWIANYGAPLLDFGSGQANSSLSVVNNLGVPASNSPFSNPMNVYGATSVAVDRNNNAWIANFDNATANQFGYDPMLNIINTEVGPLTGIGLSTPVSIAIDASNNLWFDNFGGSPDSLTVVNSANLYGATGNPVVNNLSTTGLFNASYGFAFDNSGNAWAVNDLADDLPGTLFEFSSAGALLSPPNGFTGAGLNQPAGIAIDSFGDPWVTDFGNSTLSEFYINGNPISTTPYTGGGLGASLAPAVDGNNDVWIADLNANQLAEFQANGQPITPSTGYQGGNLSSAVALAIDESGNLWIANNSPVTVNNAPRTLTEFIGLAGPVVTPLSTAVAQTQVSTKPGNPIKITILSTTLPAYYPSASHTYSAQLYASGGNSGSFTWSSSSTFPTGLALQSDGEITGQTSVSGSYSVSIRACDAQNAANCASKSFTLYASNDLPAFGLESEISGSYAFRFNGMLSNAISPSPGVAYEEAVVGSITFDGSGHFSGEEDFQSPSGTAAAIAVTGTYNFDGLDGTVELSPAGQPPLEFAFSAGNFNNSYIAQTLRFIEFDNTIPSSGNAALGSGIGELQTPAAFAASTLEQSFVFGLQGETPCTNYEGTNPGCPQTVDPFGAIAAAGRFTGNNSLAITTGEEDAAAVGAAYSALPLTGSYTAPDSSGRGTLTLIATGIKVPAAPTHFVYYIVNSGEIFLMSSDSHATSTLLIGDALAQSGTFSDSTVSGNYIAWLEQAHGGDGLSAIATQTDSGLYDFAVGSGNQVTLTGDENKGGQLRLNQALGTVTYAIDANGRLTLPAGVDVLFYLANATQGFGVTIPDSNSSSVGMIAFQQQTATSFSDSSINGVYSFASIPPPAVLASASCGVFFAGGTSSADVTIDNIQPSGTLASEQDKTYNFTVSSSGRSVSTNSDGASSIVYVINSNTVVIMDTDINSSTGTISFAQQ